MHNIGCIAGIIAGGNVVAPPNAIVVIIATTLSFLVTDINAIAS